MKRRVIATTCLGAALSICSICSAIADSEATPEDIIVDGHIHTPSDLFKLLENSSLTYVIDLRPDTVFPQDTIQPIVLQPMLSAEIVDGKPRNTKQILSDSVQALMDSAESAYERKSLDTALDLYRLILKEAPEFVQTLTLVGDVFFQRDQYDSAASYYRAALDGNSTDYQAHWFLGDALERMGDTVEALKELTTAHVLNVHHETLKKSLVAMRDRSGRPWKEWGFKPRYELRRDEAKITILCDTTFFFYAVAKALWAYEPGYAAKMRDTTNVVDRVLNLKEEREAVACALLAKDSLRTNLLEPIVAADYFPQFVLYEVIAKRNPYLMLHLTEESRNRVVDFVNEFH